MLPPLPPLPPKNSNPCSTSDNVDLSTGETLLSKLDDMGESVFMDGDKLMYRLLGGAPRLDVSALELYLEQLKLFHRHIILLGHSGAID